LTKSEITAMRIHIHGIDAPGRRPGERLWLFENLGSPQPAARAETEADFLI
jgi:hypothetical protein